MQTSGAITPAWTPESLRRSGGPGARGPFLEPEATLSDADIRVVLSAMLVSDEGVCDGAVLLEEVELWRGHVRADMVFASPAGLHIFEIKSDRDRLHRLDEQMRVYNAVADHVTLVVGWQLAAEALRRTPHWWEIWLAERAPNQPMSLVPLRLLTRNPHVDTAAIARLLPVNVALEALRARGADQGFRSKSAQRIRDAVSNVLSLQELRLEISQWLRSLAASRRTRMCCDEWTSRDHC